jgi:hypothetical protein
MGLGGNCRAGIVGLRNMHRNQPVCLVGDSPHVGWVVLGKKNPNLKR